MNFIHLQQGSLPWVEWRRGGLGGSDATTILQVPVPWDKPTTPHFLWGVKTRRHADQDSTYAMRRGQRLEPIIRDLYERRTGLRMDSICVEHDAFPWLRASLDGLDAWGELVLEIKAPRIESHEEALANRVPAYYWPQVQHQLFVTGAPLLHYVSYSEKQELAEEDRFALVEVEPDPEFIARMLAAEWAFWGRVAANWWPDEQCPAARPGPSMPVAQGRAALSLTASY